jgi:CheY-like chemotaxis protein
MLAVILPNLEDALTQVRGELREQLKEAVEATLSAADLVRQLLRLAHNEPAIQHRKIELVSLIKEAFQISRRTFDRQILMIFSPPSEPCWTFGNRSDLQQVIFNLLLNARDAVAGASAPNIELRITASTGELGCSIWQVTIIDNGVGISAENLKRIGEPFFTTKGPSQGTGMGLATAMRIARLHGGRLHCRSIEGEGATFCLELPQVSPDQTTDASTSEHTWMRRVLLIDDEHMLGRALTRGLRRSGIELVQAHGGREGIAHFSAHHALLSAVLLDLSMPDISGVAVLAHLQQIDPSVPVLIMSGHIDPALDLSAAKAVMQKPIRVANIVERLQQLWTR